MLPMLNNSIWSKKFWKRSTELAVRGAAHSIILAGGLGNGVLNIEELDVPAVAGFALGGIVLSYLTSLASTKRGDKESPTVNE